MYSRELETFIAVAEAGSFLKAAEEQGMTPASVMNRMNALERRVGARLFERTNQGARLTAAGTSFLSDARQIRALADDAVRKARQLDSPGRKVIRVGTSVLRPAKTLIELWSEADDGTLPFRIDIVPFDDEPERFAAVLASLGSGIDCFAGPFDSAQWRQSCNVLPLGAAPCRVAVPRNHRLAKKTRLSWADMDGETLMLIRRGESAVLDRLRDDIRRNHPGIRILDVPHFYDTRVFNECERLGCLMETLDIWADVHPSLVTLAAEWRYEIPCGIVWPKRPSEAVREFIAAIGGRLAAQKNTAIKPKIPCPQGKNK